MEDGVISAAHRLIISGLARAKIGGAAALRPAVAGGLSGTSTHR